MDRDKQTEKDSCCVSIDQSSISFIGSSNLITRSSIFNNKMHLLLERMYFPNKREFPYTGEVREREEEGKRAHLNPSILAIQIPKRVTQIPREATKIHRGLLNS